MNVLVTGATGFLGGALAKRLARDSRYTLRAAVRRIPLDHAPRISFIKIGDLSADTDWASALVGIEVVIHTAARVHASRDNCDNPLHQYRRVNVNGTLNLARQAAATDVKRFIFISSVKVNGEQTSPDKPFVAEDQPNPLDAYGISKYEAEVGLRQLAKETRMEVVIIRPPLVYGPGVRANFRSMMLWVNRGVPLPLGAIKNRRSLVGLDNLVDLIITCINHPDAGNQTFLAGDGEDLSTTELLQQIGKALDKPARLFPVPVGLLTLIAALVGKKYLAQRLLGSLQVDISRTREILGWEPPVSVEEGLRLVAEDFTLSRSNTLQD